MGAQVAHEGREMGEFRVNRKWLFFSIFDFAGEQMRAIVRDEDKSKQGSNCQQFTFHKETCPGGIPNLK